MGPLNYRWLLLAYLLLGTTACQTEAPDALATNWEQLAPILERQEQLYCKMDSLQQAAIGLWDRVVEQLATQLPENLPPDERRNILAVRNRALIQMFMVYDSLQPSIRQQVELAGQQDSLIAQAMKVNNTKAEKLENTLDSTLAQLKKQLPTPAYRSLTAQLANQRNERKSACGE